MRISRAWTDDKLRITWLTVEATKGELQRVDRWIEENRTQWVMRGKSEVKWSHDASFITRSKTPLGDIPLEQKFGFKEPSDAMRFKLTWS